MRPAADLNLRLMPAAHAALREHGADAALVITAHFDGPEIVCSCAMATGEEALDTVLAVVTLQTISRYLAEAADAAAGGLPWLSDDPRVTGVEARPLALDLFCGGGGVAEGLIAAGFAVVGLDLDARCARPYPGYFVLGDALAPPMRLDRFALVWASPAVPGVLRRHTGSAPSRPPPGSSGPCGSCSPATRGAASRMCPARRWRPISC